VKIIGNRLKLLDSYKNQAKLEKIGENAKNLRRVSFFEHFLAFSFFVSDFLDCKYFVEMALNVYGTKLMRKSQQNDCVKVEKESKRRRIVGNAGHSKINSLFPSSASPPIRPSPAFHGTAII